VDHTFTDARSTSAVIKHSMKLLMWLASFTWLGFSDEWLTNYNWSLLTVWFIWESQHNT